MTYGLRIINDDSELLIDSEYINPTFVQKLEFDTTPTLTEAPSGFIHPGYIRREYKTTNTVSMGVAGMAYVVMWTLPDNGGNDIYYNFDTSVAYLTEKLTCYVYANSTGSALTYTLPTAYVFAVTAAGINSLTSTGHALRMFNSAGQKTFDSNFVQLAPYSISDTFAFSVSGANVNNYGTTPVSISLSVPSNPIFMLPDFHALRVNKGPVNSIAHQEYLYETAFKRIGSILYTRLYVVDYFNEDYAWPLTQTTFTSGNNNQLSIIVADANLYEAVSAGGGGGGSNPTYTLSSDYSSRNEGTTVVVTLNTTLVANYTEFFYTVTGIAAADLSSGGLTGKFVVVNNTASASFTFANDLLTEGTETFVLSLDGLTQSVSVVVNDTSKTAIYSWSTPGNVNEGATGYTTFNATNANGKTVTFGVVAPLSGTSISGSSDGALLTSSWTVSGDAATSINVQYSAVADLTTEGPEAFRLIATVDGVTYTSDDIIVNDTSKTAGYALSAADNWNESNSYPVTVSANNVNGTTLYLTTDNALVTPSSSTVTVNSDSFISNVTFTTGIATANTSVRISLRTGSTSGTEVAFKAITLVNITPSYSFGTTSAFNEGTSGSVQFNYSYAGNTTITFELTAPSSGASGVSDVTLNTTSYSVGATNNAGNVSVTYSAAADSFTEGPEYFRINAKVGGSVIATSGDITINDTSLTAAAYSLTRSVASVNEGGSFSITFATNQSGSFAYTITGVSSADIDGASLTGTVSNGTVLTYSVTADITTEGTETFTIALNNGQASTSVTINDTSIYPASGTFVNAYCLSYGSAPYTYRQVYNNGSGGTYNVDTNNSPTCGYIAPSYSLARSTSSVSEGGSFTITLSTNQAGYFSYTISGVSSADINGASLYGSLTNGGVLTVNVTADATTEGTEYFNIALDNGQASTSVTISDTSVYPAYGTLVTAYCLTYSAPYTYRQVYNNGSGGTYNVDTNNSTTCGYVAPTPYGTYLSQYCAGGNGYSLYYRYADGNYGYYDVLQANNSATCGYVAPAYSIGNTWSNLANGAGPQFYYYATNANGTYVTVTASGPGASRVNISPASFTVSGTSFFQYIQVTASLPSSATPAQSVTISLSTGQSFSFTIDAVTAQIPWVSSVVDSMYNNIYYNGETITYNINMSSSITPDTIVRVAIWINVLANGTGGQEAGYNDFTGGQPISGVNGFFPLGTYAGYYTTNPNAGYNFKVMVKARTISPGNVQSTYVNGTVRQLSSNAPP